MNKKLGILGVLMVVALAICGAFSTPLYAGVSATEIMAQETQDSESAGTFVGEASYNAGDEVVLDAKMNLGYDFDCWIGTYEDGETVRLSTEKQCSFIAKYNITVSAQWKRAGIFTAEGANYVIEEGEVSFYVWGGNVRLKAEMCDGYRFIGWVTYDEDRVVLSTDVEYSFTITENMSITPEWERIEYQVLFNTNLNKDFILGVTNTTQQGGKNYYNDEMNIVIEMKENCYSENLVLNNIKINGETLYTIQNNNPMSVVCEIENDNNENLTGQGFIKAVITLNIQQDIIIDINYVNMYKLSIVSGNNRINIDDIIDFLTVTGYYSKDEENHTYLVSSNRLITINNNRGDDIYKFNTFVLEGLSPNSSYSSSFYLNENKTLTLYYSLEEYAIQFNAYVINQNEQLEKTNEILTIELVPGDEIGLIYDSNILTINYYGYGEFADEIINTTQTDFETLVGYRFKWFEVDNVEIDEKYILPTTQSVEIKLVFEKIRYTLTVDFVDDFFENDTTYSLNGQTSLQLVEGQDILFNVNTEKYVINDWSWSWKTAPTLAEINEGLEPEQKFESLNDALLAGQTFEFNPTSSDEMDCVITLNVGYKYMSTTYSLKSNSISEEVIEGETAYTYFADLQILLINEIYFTLKESNTKADIVLKGVKYTDTSTSNENLVSIENVNVERKDDKYVAKYQGYSIELYVNDIDEGIQMGDYILFPNVKYSEVVHTTRFDYNGVSFAPIISTGVNKPDNITKTVIKEGGEYYITLNNLLHSAVLMYGAKSTDDDLYQIRGFRNSADSSLTRFKEGDYAYCLYPVTRLNEVYIEYYKIENEVILEINNLSAYSYDNIKITIERNGNTLNLNGDKVSAEEDDEIIIEIEDNLITKGYQLEGFVFDGVLTSNNKYEFTMKFSQYANQTIYINFIEIEYTLNVVYVDESGNQVDEPNGYFSLNDQVGDSFTLVLTGDYIFEAVADDGYYVATNGAYLGNKLKYITGLIGSNDNNNTRTTWNLNMAIFEEFIINCANDDDTITLYINFVIHTYTVKVYFTIDENASLISYPRLTLSEGVANITSLVEDIENGYSVRYVEIKDVIYNSNLVLQLDNFMTGTKLFKWTDDKGVQISSVRQCNLTQVNNNTTLTVVLEYVRYSLVFRSIDESGNACYYGAGAALEENFKLFDILKYQVSTQNGYILKDQYYLDKNEIPQDDALVNPAHYFNPEEFKLEGTTITIYLVFGLKEIKLNISNAFVGYEYYFKDMDPNEVAPFEVTKNGDATILDSDNYVFQTGDILVMKISPISAGIAINTIKLGTENSSDYSLTIHNKYDVEDLSKIIGYYYEVRIEFNANLIDILFAQAKTNGGVAIIVNNLQVKSYDINYTYNYRAYEFGMRLVYGWQEFDGSKINNRKRTGNSDIAGIFSSYFGMEISFYCKENTLTTGEGPGTNFKIKGYSINGINVDENTTYTLNATTDIGLAMWEQIALDRYINNKGSFDVEMILEPKITLVKTEYSFVYNSNPQDIPANAVTVGNDFEIIKKYSYDGGVTFSDEKPINVGEYLVQIIAKIEGNGKEPIYATFKEKITLRITTKTLTLSFRSYSQLNPLTKTYDGLRTVSLDLIREELEINGVCDNDIGKINIDMNRLVVKLSGIDANTKENLYNVILEDVYLKDGNNEVAKNYDLKVETFKSIALVKQRTLKIVGIPEIKKVNDGSTEIVIDLTGISYTGQLPGLAAPEVMIENLKFYHDQLADDFSGVVTGKIDWSKALLNTYNYTIAYDDFDVEIYPYQLEYYVNGYGMFKIVDLDKKCLIPIGSKMLAGVYAKGSNTYRSLFAVIEQKMSKGEKLNYCYEVILQVEGVNRIVPEGLYMSIPKVAKTSKILQISNMTLPEEINFTTENSEFIIKVESGKGLFCLVIKTTYLPLWLIILIVVLSLSVIGLIVGVIIIIRRKTQKKYKKYDMI